MRVTLSKQLLFLLMLALCWLWPGVPALALEIEAAEMPQTELFSRYFGEERVEIFRTSADYAHVYPYWGQIYDVNNNQRELYGLVDEQGRIVLDPVLTQFGSYVAEDGRQYWQLRYQSGHHQIISADGAWASDRYEATSLHFDGKRLVRYYSRTTPGRGASTPLFDIYDRQGREIMRQREGYILLGYVEGYCLVQEPWQDEQQGRHLYLDGEGHMAFGRTFARAGNFSHGLAVVWEEAKSGPALMDQAGNYVIAPGLYSYISNNLAHGFLGLRNEKNLWGMADSEGRIIFPLEYQSITFSSYLDFSVGTFYCVGSKDGQAYLLDPHSGVATPMPNEGEYVGGGWQIISAAAAARSGLTPPDRGEVILRHGDLTRRFTAEGEGEYSHFFAANYLGNDIFAVIYRRQQLEPVLGEQDMTASYLLLYDAMAGKELIRLPGWYESGEVNAAGYLRLRQISYPISARELYLCRDTADILFGGSYASIRELAGGQAYQVTDNAWVGLRRPDGNWLLRVKPSEWERPELVGVSAWAKENVSSAIAAQLAPKDLQSKYQQSISRIEFCDLIATYVERVSGKAISDYARTHGYPVRSDVFSDTSNKHADCAYAMGIVDGVGNGRFDPDGAITREQAALMLTRLHKAMGSDVSGAAPMSFADGDSISPWAMTAVDYVCARGIMGGVGDNCFNPQGTYTREQAIVTFWRMLILN